MARRFGTLLLVIGSVVLAWVATVYLWKDPFTTAYTAYEQRRLMSMLDRQFDAFLARRGDNLSQEARRFRLASEEGDAIARLRVPRLNLSAVVVNGTSAGDLRRGPGRHLETYLPGEGELVYIAGHRTTYGAPFSEIDRLQPGDRISIELPYGTVDYRVTTHRIVDDNDLSVLDSRGREELVLQACHPRFFSSQRYLVYARPISVATRR